jgi:arylsulfate sulfotransferase
MTHSLRRNLLALLLTIAGTTVARGMTVALTPSVPSPLSVGTLVTFTSAVPDAPGNKLWYQFRVRRQGDDYQIVRDYGPINSLDWTAAKREGIYEVAVSARNLDTGEESSVSLLYQFQSLVTAGQPVVSPTGNSLVFLYSAPGCDAGSRMRVQFQVGSPQSIAGVHSTIGTGQNTPYQACVPGLSMNFYLAGLLADTTYTAHHVVDNGSAFINGPDVTFTTGDLPPDLYTDTILVPAQNPASDSILLGGPLGASPVANDLSGNVLWYGPSGLTFLARAEAGGEFWGIAEQPGDTSQQILRKYDLTGMTLRETNAARVNEQLTALGKQTITGFHHEARPIRGGRVAVLAGVEQILTDVQGPGPIDVLGDMIVVLDKDLNVVWTWNSFDNLDVSRAAVLGEVCPSAGCPAFYLASSANDWTHGNALQETADGNILYSARNQDWLIKISYDGGAGNGHIIWRLGKDGDFQIGSTDPYPWFSHQHDGNFETADPSMLMVFDDGNTRVAQMHGGNSRGQVYRIDELNMAATPVLSADLGVYSLAVGSAQQLLDGNYHFDAGFVSENGTLDAYSFEVNPAGATVYEAHQNVSLYRTFRMTDMYTPN